MIDMTQMEKDFEEFLKLRKQLDEKWFPPPKPMSESLAGPRLDISHAYDDPKHMGPNRIK